MSQQQAPLTLPDDHLGLYIHIPFCARKCRYCDFPSRAGDDAATIDRYLDALAREARRYHGTCRPPTSIFIGGGTPSLLRPAQLERLWATVVAPFAPAPETECTIEGNPGTITPAWAAMAARLPITRVSLGVQSLHDDDLAVLGRVHTAAQARDTVALIRETGQAAINLDLMYRLPGQDAARWGETLARALALYPDHLSLYALTVEDETPLCAQVEAGVLSLPSEEEEEAMSAVTGRLVDAAGYRQYEVSNFARVGRECRQNLGYWLGRDYLGLGAAATSTMGGVRRRNLDNIDVYIARATAGLPVTGYIERLAAPERLLERVMLGLRLTEGFVLAEAEHACGYRLMATIGDAIDRLRDEGLLAYDGTVLRLTRAGAAGANRVVARLMAARAA